MRVIRMDKNGKILIVDDAKSNREILSEILNQYTVIKEDILFYLEKIFI